MEPPILIQLRFLHHHFLSFNQHRIK
jgi:hypothetical protein